MGKGEEIPKTNPAEIEAVIARIKQSNIEQRDVELIERLLRTVLVLVKLLERKNISIKKLREMVFGRRTEKRREASGAIGEKSGETDRAEEEERRKERGEAGNVERSSSKSAKRQVSGGHGHRAAAAYPGAKIVRCQHRELKVGDRCPDPSCGGRLYDLNEPKVLLQFTGQPWIEATNYLKVTGSSVGNPRQPRQSRLKAIFEEKWNCTDVGTALALYPHAAPPPGGKQENRSMRMRSIPQSVSNRQAPASLKFHDFEAGNAMTVLATFAGCSDQL